LVLFLLVLFNLVARLKLQTVPDRPARPRWRWAIFQPRPVSKVPLNQNILAYYCRVRALGKR